MQRPRQSRRFACDRCRKYKLRCQRDSFQNNCCERCVQISATCTTTNANTGNHVSGRSQNSVSQPHNQQGAMDPERVTGSIFPASNLQGNDELNNISDSAGTIADSITARGSYESSFISSRVDKIHDPPSHPSLESFIFDDFNDPASWSSAPPQHVALGFQLSPLHDFLQLCTQLAYECSKYSVLDHCADTIGPSIKNALDETTRLSNILHQLATSEEEATHHSSGETGPQQGWSSPSSTLSSILSTTFTPATRSERWGESEREGQLGRQMSPVHNRPAPATGTTSRVNNQDIMMRLMPVLAYVLLTRLWRAIFLQLHNTLIEGRSGSFPEKLSLPSLQLGDFEVQNNPYIQIVVLIELCTDVFQKIEARLGIVNYHQLRVGTGTTGIKSLSLATDPVTVSIREAILSQETLSNIAEEGFNRLSLKDMMSEIKGQAGKFS